MTVARILPWCVVLALLAGGQRVSADGLSLANLSPSAKATETTPCASKTSKKEPSTLEKLSTGTKSFFTQVGDTLTLKKKPAPKKTISPFASATKHNSTSKQTPKKSWLSSLFQREQPKKQNMTPTDWIGQQRMDW